MTELIEALGDERVTPRFVRFLVAEGVIPAPRGGRAHADYGEDHAGGIRRYLQLRDLGLTATRTRDIVNGTAAGGVPVPLMSGLTLIVDRATLQQPVDARAIAARVQAVIDLITKEDV